MLGAVIAVRFLVMFVGLCFVTTSRTPTMPMMSFGTDAEDARAKFSNTTRAKPRYDIRGNSVEATEAETRWAVRVLSESGKDNKPLALLWPRDWPDSGRQTRAPMELLVTWIKNLVHDGLELEEPLQKLSITNPQQITFAINRDDHYSFKSGMDRYVLGLLERRKITGKGHDCERVGLSDRHYSVRALRMFEKRGRKSLREDDKRMRRYNSIENTHAGIAQLENTPTEALDYFPQHVIHYGKNQFTRSKKGTAKDFEDLGAPFIAGASGSIEFLILSMERDTFWKLTLNVKGKPLWREYSLGIVPCKTVAVKDGNNIRYRPLLREALIALMSAILIAGGQHSLTECLAVAQAMGYFEDVPRVLEDYTKAVQAFEKYVDEWLGLRGGQELTSLEKSVVAT